MSHGVMTLVELGKHFGKCRRTMQRWRRAGMPRTAGGGYDVGQVETWLETARYLGATFRKMEADERVNSLFERAVVELRQGLQHLCESFVRARGKGRSRLIDRAVRDILHGAAHQQSLLENEGEKALTSCDDSGNQVEKPKKIYASNFPLEKRF